jgi:hypothetical protein
LPDEALEMWRQNRDFEKKSYMTERERPEPDED